MGSKVVATMSLNSGHVDLCFCCYCCCQTVCRLIRLTLIQFVFADAVLCCVTLGEFDVGLWGTIGPFPLEEAVKTNTNWDGWETHRSGGFFPGQVIRVVWHGPRGCPVSMGGHFSGLWCGEFDRWVLKIDGIFETRNEDINFLALVRKECVADGLKDWFYGVESGFQHEGDEQTLYSGRFFNGSISLWTVFFTRFKLYLSKIEQSFVSSILLTSLWTISINIICDLICNIKFTLTIC